MSARSLFAFDNPNGQIGSRYNATDLIGVTSLVFSFSYNPQNLALLPPLPLGVYMISVNINLVIVGEAGFPPLPIQSWKIGAGYSSLSLALGSCSAIAFPTDIITTSFNTNSYLQCNFIINNTNPNSPIYIVTQPFFNQALNNSLLYANLSTYPAVIATKLA